MTFGNWDESIHNDFDQIKRISYIKKIKPEDITVNPSNETATVNGTGGTYDVSLNSCTCYDFTERQLPCKHMYRLASELGYLDDLPKTNRKAAKEFKDRIPEEIERYKSLYLNGAISIEKFVKIANAIKGGK